MKYKPIKNKYGYYECSPKPNPEYLINFYKKIYFKKKVSQSFSNFYSKEETKNKRLKAKFDIGLIKKRVGKKKIKFLEIGSGEGFILNEAHKQKNWEVIGVDYNDFAINKFNKKAKSFFVKEDPEIFLKKANNLKFKFDVIVLNNVLEHVIDPKKLLIKIRNLINIKSVVFISIPNDYSILQTLSIKSKKNYKAPWFQPPQHISYFNTLNIENFLKKNNFKLIDMVSNFPIEIFLFSKFSFYYNNSKKGKSVHEARLFLENLIFSNGFEKSYSFFKSCANIGFGRNFSVLIKKNK